MLVGRQQAIHEERDRKLEAARELRAKLRAQQASVSYADDTRPEDRALLGSTPSAESMSKAIVVDVVGLLTASTPANCL